MSLSNTRLISFSRTTSAREGRRPGDALLVQLAPRVDARVVDGARVVRVRLYLPVDVIVAEGDVIPLGCSEVLQRDLDRRPFGRGDMRRQHALYLTVQKEDVMTRV